MDSTDRPRITRKIAVHRAAENLRAADREMASDRANWELANVKATIGLGFATLAVVLSDQEDDVE